MPNTLAQRFEFLTEIEKLRGVNRHNKLLDGTRVENSAEHSWHLALYALVLQNHAPAGVDIQRVIQMLLLHDVVEIDVGDHPIHEAVDWDAVARAEEAAAARIFDLLPAEQASTLSALWHEFEGNATPDAQFAKALDRAQPLFQTLCNPSPAQDHVAICRENIETGRAAVLERHLPSAYSYLRRILDGDLSGFQDANFTAQIAFLNEADQLKSILRASKLADGSRYENSAEHSWHILMFAWILASYAHQAVDLQKVLTMLILHDLVEIDAGDAPIHGVVSAEALAKVEAEEQAAADRIFGLLPEKQGQNLRAIWEEFEASETPEAIYAKSIDRVQPVLLNLANGGGSWVDYDVSLDQIDTRVGAKVRRGAGTVWDHVRPMVADWFAANGRA
ncbi:HD domain-containing protein [Epibacterium ulvae]|uniref:HD domain-containing protein n=1 Tax=Epibacterium ulvae TaxID=1156985 RepID=UPI001BFBFE79|nr:HD domain-containing protein [Epibacterium ulvae]